MFDLGGGPTSVEFAAELNDFMMEDVIKYFPGIKPKIIVVFNIHCHLNIAYMYLSVYVCIFVYMYI